jgi:hypothetical protein
MSVCIGYGEFKGSCGNGPDLDLNQAGLWCTRCELLRRDTISASMAKITAGFDAARESKQP